MIQRHWWRNLFLNQSAVFHIILLWVFGTRTENSPPVTLYNKELPEADDVKYLGMHLYRHLTWRKHIETKRKELNFKTSKIYWLLLPKSKLSLENKLLVYKVILKPIWTYSIQL